MHLYSAAYTATRAPYDYSLSGDATVMSGIDGEIV